MRTCPYCDGPITSRNPRATRCAKPECVKAKAAEAQRKWQAAYAERNGIRYEVQRYDEQRKARRAANPNTWTDAARREAWQRRHKLKRAPGSETFDRREIFERDGWVCALCEKPVDPDLAYPDLMSASLDHRIPLAENGPHTRANAQCAHLRCNVTRPRASYRTRAAEPR